MPETWADFDHFVKSNWTVSRGLRPALPPPRSPEKTLPLGSHVTGHGRTALDMALLEKRIKGCLLNDDYSGLLRSAQQLLEIDSHSAAGWFHTGVSLLGLVGVSTKTPFLQFQSLPRDRRIQINAALRALHTASICQASSVTMAEIYTMKALGRFSLGQLQGAYQDLQLALRHVPGFTLALDLMQSAAMQAVYRKQAKVLNSF